MMTYVNLPRNIKPTRGLFYGTVVAGFVLGLAMLNDIDGDYEFSLGIIISAFIYLAIGVFIIYNKNIRDSIFGISECPHCHQFTITIKDKLKATIYEDNTYAKCSRCGEKARLPWYYLLLMLIFIIPPLAVLIYLDCIQLMFVVFWICAFIFLYYLGRHMDLVA